MGFLYDMKTKWAKWTAFSLVTILLVIVLSYVLSLYSYQRSHPEKFLGELVIFFNEQPDWVRENSVLLNSIRNYIFHQMKKPSPRHVQEYLAIRRRPDYLVVAIGDSLTAGHKLLPKQRYVYFLEKLIAYHLPGKTVKVINAGVPGNTIRAIDARLERDMIDLKPDAVILGTGFNDNRIITRIGDKYESIVPLGQYRRQYEKVVSRITNETKARVILFSPAPVAPHYENLLEREYEKGQLGVFENYVPIAEDIAKKFGCSFADVYTAVKEHPMYHQAYLQDGLHPNPLGNLIMVYPIFETWLKVANIEMKEPFVTLVKNAIGKIPWKAKRTFPPTTKHP